MSAVHGAAVTTTSNTAPDGQPSINHISNV